MRRYSIEPKAIRMVHPKIESEAKMVLIEGAKDGGEWLKVLKPLIIYDEEGNYIYDTNVQGKETTDYDFNIFEERRNTNESENLISYNAVVSTK